MKILNKLTIKHLKLNKKRTIVTIIGVILSTALMVGIGLLFSTLRDNQVKFITDYAGSHHIKIKSDNLDLVNEEFIKSYKYKSSLGYSLYEGIKNEYKPYLEILTASNNYLNELDLISGRLPLNSNEIIIPEHLKYNGGIDIKIDDILKLNVGKRYNEVYLDETPLVNEFENDKVLIDEELKDTFYKEYKVVGIIKRDILEIYENPGYNCFTIDNSNNYTIYLNYKNIKDTFKNTKELANKYNYKELDENLYDNIDFNYQLLDLYGVTKYSDSLDSMVLIIIFILSLISIACIIVTYNAFAISVMERKKQFGLFSSIGATKKQIRYMVFLEAFIVGIIGIPLGILSSYLGIGTVLIIINNLLELETEFVLATYPIFIIIPIIFMILVITISAYIPALKASKVNPIEAIRLNDEIKIKSKKLKTPKIVKLFGVEGVIAYKNMKRNKKKYRITIISLFISIVLFISFSAFLDYGLRGAFNYTEVPKYGYSINMHTKDLELIKNKIDIILNTKGITKKSIYSTYSFSSMNKEILAKEYNDYLNKTGFSYDNYFIIINVLDNDSYNEYKKEIKLKDKKPILINSYNTIEYTDNTRKSVEYNIVKDIKNIEFEYGNNKYKLDDLYLTDKFPFGLESSLNQIEIVINEEMFNKLNIKKDTYMIDIYLNSSDYKLLDDLFDKKNSNNILDDDVEIYNFNINKEMKLLNNMIFIVKLLLYGFISLVTLIGITSVINTINTSVNLRKKEFAILRSVGLTPKGFNKMILFECFLFGFKSLLYGIPVALLNVFIFHKLMNNLVTFKNILIPYKSIFICIISVFIIVLFTMLYATKKLKKSNIIDTIREENI